MTNAYNDIVDWLSVGRSRTEIKKSVQFSPILVSVGYKTPSKIWHKKIKCKVLLHDTIFSALTLYPHY